jgi:phospholipase D1/2
VVAGQHLTIDIWDVDSREANAAPRKIGSLSGTVHVSSRQEGFAPVYALSDLHVTRAQPSSDDSIAVMVTCASKEWVPGLFPVETVDFPLPPWAEANLHGRHWQVCFEVDGEIVCAPIPVHVASHQLEVGKECTYERHDGNAVTFYNDASEDPEGTRGYFADLLKAIDGAREFILIADWSFQPLFRLNRKVPGLDATIGAILLKKAKENTSVLIAIHTWDHTSVGPASDEQNDLGDDVLMALANGPLPENLVWTRSSRSLAKWSHHQKMVVVDTDGASGRRDLMAFVGGLDLSRGRFDWPAHRVRADGDGPGAAEFKRMLEPLSVKIPKPARHPDGMDEDRTQTIAADDWYNAELDAVARSTSGFTPRQPWHDVHACIKGPTAFDLVTEFIGRWLKTAGTYRGRQFAPKLHDLYHRNFSLSTHQKDTTDGNRFVRQYDSRDLSEKTPWSAQVYRSMDRSQWKAPDERPSLDGERDGWSVVGTFERSIQGAYIQNIGLAERFIYIETQFFIGSGENWVDKNTNVSNPVPDKLVERILHHYKRKTRFHVYVVTPMFPEGDLYSAPVVQQRWNQWLTIESMVTRLHATMEDRWQDYLSFYFPFQAGEATYKAKGANRAEQLRAAQRYQIYVHSKMMIVDDEYAIIGSANLNERSLAGDRDTEICVGMWPANARMRRACTEALQEFRGRLWSEHLSKLPPSWKSPEHIDCVRDVRNTSLRRFLALKNELPAPEAGHLMALPLRVGYRPDPSRGSLLRLRVEPLLSTDPELRKAHPGEGDDATPMMFLPDHVGIDCGTWWSEPSYLDNNLLRDVTE